jgi:hypothetical protein
MTATDSEDRAGQLAKIHAFGTVEAVKAGLLDDHLVTILQAVRDRLILTNQNREPSTILPPGQVWAWMWDEPAPPPSLHGEEFLQDTRTRGHWEVRGTGVIIDPEMVPQARRDGARGE